MASSASNVVGVHYRVGKKIGEGSFGVIFEGTNLLNNQQVAIKFVSLPSATHGTHSRARSSLPPDTALMPMIGTSQERRSPIAR